MVFHDIEEDYPKCEVEMIKSCAESKEIDNLVDPDEDCGEVEVTRCRIARRRVRKAKPATWCGRVPNKTCNKHKIEPA